MKKPFLSRALWALVLLSTLVGLWLRCANVNDMEYKEDEAYHFNQSQLVGKDGTFPWVGIPSGVYVKNPGLSVWIFAGLARVTRSHTPTELARAIQIFNVLSLMLLFGMAWVRHGQKSAVPTELWVWIYALAMVNPFGIYYARKLWPEGFLPAFTLGILLCWLLRKKPGHAFGWGLLGALVGQVHMSGFFLAAGLALGTRVHAPLRKLTHWRAWFVGSTLGALPLIPWLWDLWTSPPMAGPVSRGLSEALQLKYWVFWITQPFGLHIGSVVGINRGSQWQQLSDIARYPLIAGTPTYLCGLAHFALIGLLVAALAAIAKRGRAAIQRFAPESLWVLWSLGIAGLLMTLTGIQIRRYYLAVFFPLDVLAVTLPTLWLYQTRPRLWRSLLATAFGAQALISASFVSYIHDHEGAPEGDYGWAYHRVIRSSSP